MAKQKTKLRDVVKDPDLVKKITQSFSDLRADFDLSLEASAEKINELTETHVDVKDYLSRLISHTGSSSGVLQGLRGTGKTHLFLLARHEINNNLFKTGDLVIYLNAKKISLPQNTNPEIFNRVFSNFLLNGVVEHLQKILKTASTQSAWQKLKNYVSAESLTNRLSDTIQILIEMQNALLSGTRIVENYEAGEQKVNMQLKELIEAFESMTASIGLSSASAKLSAQKKEVSEKTLSKEESSKYISYLDINHISSILKKNNISSKYKIYNILC
ncbi:hypothetical protein [Pseudomonas oryzihabitans]|uniref:hypothetical protein n=1 Tax=Pseudomonas oryzihabitans TaxID=47885 RepID=UPI001ABF8473|nr:hypothetical protein [Pseudomonas oryzihabitans]